MHSSFTGKKIAGLRSDRKLTQKELADRAGIDIRTLQRIESGEVIPRYSTLLLICGVLECDPDVFQTLREEGAPNTAKLFLALSITGLVYLISWLFYGSPFPRPEFALNWSFVIGIVYMLSAVLFFYGFRVLGSRYHNGLLRVSSIVVMVLVPLFFFSTLPDPVRFGFILHIRTLLVLLFGINGLLFGSALLRIKSPVRNIYIFAGIIQLLQAPFYILPFPLTWGIGNWIGFPVIVLFVLLIFLEYRLSAKPSGL